MENPFSSRFVTPGSCELVGVGSNSEGAFSFELNHGVFQIVGAHGSGKTTLACEIGRRNVKNGTFEGMRNVVIRNGRVVSQFSGCETVGNNELLIVDGIESISWLNRRLFIAWARRNKVAVLFTTHANLAGVDVICQLAPCEIHFKKLLKTFN